MIICDPRKGSGELLPYFRPYDVPVQLLEIQCGDFAFYIEGPDGVQLAGFERKVITDLMTSKRDNRLQGFQLPNMSEVYPNFCHLIVEGIWQAGESGMIETWQSKGWRTTKPAMKYREIDHFLAELQYKRGIYVERTSSRQATVAYLVSRYKFFNDQVWSQHNRTEKIYALCNPLNAPGLGSKRGGFIKRTVPTLERQLLQVDGVGSDSYWVGARYGNMENFMLASPEEIAETMVERNTKEGRKQARLGQAKAVKMWRAEREK